MGFIFGFYNSRFFVREICKACVNFEMLSNANALTHKLKGDILMLYIN